MHNWFCEGGGRGLVWEGFRRTVVWVARGFCRRVCAIIVTIASGLVRFVGFVG